ncbi:hypothetical protein [Solimonas sp. SE-A11]|uniref:hypothetical protein n=1 Tax=Solimonas sp. SE-A11 TaxID=3054954 RepID=UPI00259CC0FF|nr:hypothetical protein [Solimonas sp. SE-A11]MDM4772601.1 hypothetical protein [Solimonas sp. SE-A11]
MRFNKTASEFFRDERLNDHQNRHSEALGTFAFLSDIEREGAARVQSKIGQAGWELAICQAERLGVHLIGVKPQSP